VAACAGLAAAWARAVRAAIVSAAALLWTITAYSTGCDTRPGARTKAGTTPVPGFTAAADPRVLPLGSIVWVEGLGELQVQDVGSAVRGRTLDLYVSSCAEARLWGRRRARVRVLHRGGSR
jgi:3D (Asp-Asp-Asp) domain-containing protein